MEMIIAKVQEIINSVLEIIKTWEIGDYIFVGVDVLLVIIILCLLSRRSRRKRKEKKALKRQKLNAVEVNNETIVEEVVESPIIEETPVISTPAKNYMPVYSEEELAELDELEAEEDSYYDDDVDYDDYDDYYDN